MNTTKTQKLSPHQELLLLHKRIYKENQRVIKHSTSVNDAKFKIYYRNYRRAIEDYTNRVSIPQVENQIARSNVVLVGDYHTLKQSQKSFLRVLKSYSKNKKAKPFVVALELFQASQQKHLNAYLNNQISEQEFLRKTKFQKHWFFDLWKNYKVIFDYLKDNQIQAYAIEAPLPDKKSLLERDEFMASHIAEIANNHPKEQIFVLVGDLHLAKQHLPKFLKQEFKKKKLDLRLTSLFQNSQHIYWKLSEKNLVDHTIVVKLSDNEFCRMHTPPIIVQQSYLNWLYHEEGSFDWSDAKSSFLELIQNIAHILKLSLSKDYENVEVYTCGDLSFLKVLRAKKIFSKTELKIIHNQILTSQSYCMPKARMVYIANVSINHAAEEASHYLKFLCTGLEQPRSHVDAFYANVLHEAVGFFGSKLINSKRKCARAADFKRELSYLIKSHTEQKFSLEYKTAELFLKHETMVKKRSLFHFSTVSFMPTDLFLSLSHAIGYDLGDRLYYAYISKKIDLDCIQSLFCDAFEEEGEPGRLYLDVFAKLKTLKRPLKV